MSVDVQHPGLFRFSCGAAAATLLVIPAIYIADALLRSPDHALHDTYYVAANAQALTLMTALVICHLGVAAGCAVLAKRASAGYIAGWMMALSAAMMAVAQAAPSFVMMLTPQPQRYVDYVDAPQVAFWIFDVAQYGSMVAVVGMAAGWVILAAMARWRQAGAN